MLTTQRLLIMIICINVLIGTAQEFYFTPETHNEDILTVENQLLEQYQNELDSEEGVWGATKRTVGEVVETTLGNPFKWGINLLNLFFQGINPLSITPTDVSHPVEKQMVRYLIFMKGLMGAILMLEVYLVWKNKKQT